MSAIAKQRRSKSSIKEVELLREIPCNGHFESEQITCLDDFLIISYCTSTRILGPDGVVKPREKNKEIHRLSLQYSN